MPYQFEASNSGKHRRSTGQFSYLEQTDNFKIAENGYKKSAGDDDTYWPEEEPEHKYRTKCVYLSRQRYDVQ